MIPTPQNSVIEFLYSIKVGVLALIYSVAAVYPTTTILVSAFLKDLINLNEEISKLIVLNLGIASSIIAFVSLLYKLIIIREEYKQKQKEYKAKNNE
jgi:hypothetical protein